MGGAGSDGGVCWVAKEAGKSVFYVFYLVASAVRAFSALQDLFQRGTINSCPLFLRAQGTLLSFNDGNESRYADLILGRNLLLY